MKLALIRRQFSATGGAELYVQRLLGALTTAGHETHLFAEKWQGQAAGVQFHSVNVEGSRAERPLRFAEGVNAALQHERFDCVFSLERTLKQDVYRAGDGLHRVWLQRRRQFAPWWKRPLVGVGAFHRNMMVLEARTFDPTNTRHIIVNSEMVRGEIAQHFPAFPQERVHTIRNGVEVRRFKSVSRAAARQRFGREEKDFVLVFVGSGWERKGLPWLLKFMAGRSDEQVELEAARLVQFARESEAETIVVTSDVDFGFPMDGPESRRIRRLAGQVNFRLADAAARLYWMVFGVPQRIR